MRRKYGEIWTHAVFESYLCSFAVILCCCCSLVSFLVYFSPISFTYSYLIDFFYVRQDVSYSLIFIARASLCRYIPRTVRSQKPSTLPPQIKPLKSNKTSSAGQHEEHRSGNNVQRVQGRKYHCFCCVTIFVGCLL